MGQNNEIPVHPPEVLGAGGKNKIIQTYAEDMVGVIESDKSGLIKKIIHEEEKHEEEKRNLSPESKKNKFFMFVSFLFISLSLITLSYLLLMKEITTVEIEAQFIPIVFVDQSVFLEVKDFDKDKIVQTILNEINTTKVKNGGVEGIYLSYDKRVVGLREFFALIEGNFQPKADQILADVPGVTSFVNDNFLMGVVNTSGKPASSASAGKDFFILLKMRSFADIFDSLRLWESKMFLDLHEFFGVEITPETNYLLTKNFEDGVVENKNARILYDNDNNIIMMYVLANDTSIIITNTKNASKEIMLRLATGQIKK